MPASPQGSAGPGDAVWLALCQEAARRLGEVLEGHPTTAERAVDVGRGEGGDRSLVIDQAAEAEVFSLLDDLHAEGRRFTAVSEERGWVDYGDPAMLVVIDPIDGSL